MCVVRLLLLAMECDWDWDDFSEVLKADGWMIWMGKGKGEK